MKESPVHIRYLTREEIDIAKWDQCVKDAANGWLYARSFFLDGICQWNALVVGDYEYILPLPIKKKFGFRYIYLPPFTGQLGIIGSGPVSAALAALFIRSIPDSIQLADICMNEQNPAIILPKVFSIRRTNYIIPLRENYEVIRKRYSKDAQKNIRKAKDSSLIALPGISLDRIIGLYKAAYGKKNKNLSDADCKRFNMLGDQCIENGNGFSVGIMNQDNELLAAAFFGMDEKRIYYILGAPGLMGRKYNAVHFLIDEVIKQFAGKELVFDFEGSDIPSVAQFYKKFNPIAMNYDFIRLNRLPWLIRFLKRKHRNI
jgi:hypothetical protein